MQLAWASSTPLPGLNVVVSVGSVIVTSPANIVVLARLMAERRSKVFIGISGFRRL